MGNFLRIVRELLSGHPHIAIAYAVLQYTGNVEVTAPKVRFAIDSPLGNRIRTCMGLFLSSVVLVWRRFFVRSGKAVLRPVDCGRDAHYWAPPAQNRTCGIPASGSHLGCLAAKRCCGQGWRILGLGSQSSASLATRSHVRSSLWLRRRSVRRHRSRTWKRKAARARPLVGTPW